MTTKEIAGYIDHTILKADAMPNDIVKLCNEARKYDFAAVCVNPVYAELASSQVQDSGVAVCTVTGFPLGASTSKVKVEEALMAIQHGATEIDMVIHVGALKAGNDDAVLYDIQAVVSICAQHGAICKVIIETAMLSEDEKKRACQMVKRAHAQYIKTSTGFGPGGATEADVRLLAAQMKDTQILVKAAGGIRSRADAEKMIAAGATRIGTSAGVKIMEGTK